MKYAEALRAQPGVSLECALYVDRIEAGDRGAIRHLLETCAFESPTQGTLL